MIKVWLDEGHSRKLIRTFKFEELESARRMVNLLNQIWGGYSLTVG